jgi:hypothetical protein
MPHEFTEWEHGPEAQASSGRSGIPPRKFTTAGVLDPPVPPKRPIGPIPGIPASLLLRVFAAIALAAIIVSVVLIFFARH